MYVMLHVEKIIFMVSIEYHVAFSIHDENTFQYMMFIDFIVT